MYNQKIKADNGKEKLTLVPSEIIRNIARVREYGISKYGEEESWREVEIERYRDAAFRHLLAYKDDPTGKDSESELPHLWHLACNIAFLCELEKVNYTAACTVNKKLYDWAINNKTIGNGGSGRTHEEIKLGSQSEGF